MQNFGRRLTCEILADISAECCVQNFERNLPIILHVEFRTKSPQNPACRIHAKLSPGFHIHNFGRNLSRIVYAAEFCMQNFGRNLRIMLHAEFWPKCQQIYGPNLHIILYAEFRQKSLICRTMHAEFRLKSPHNAVCTIRSIFLQKSAYIMLAKISTQFCMHNFSEISTELCMQNFGRMASLAPPTPPSPKKRVEHL